MLKFTADLHIHTDYDSERDYWHGDRPERIAAGIVHSNVDVYAITEHNKTSTRFFDVQGEVARLLEIEEKRTGVNREVLGLLGTEMTVMFGGTTYHVGFIFDDEFTPQTLPEMPIRHRTEMKGRDLDHWRIDNPGIAILNHPTLRDIRRHPLLDITRDFMKSGLVDGVELLNGSVLHNGADIRITEKALGLYKEVFLSGGRQHRRLAAIGCSDAHVGLSEEGGKNLVGSVVTAFSSEDSRGIFNAVKKAETKAVAVDRVVKNKVASVMRNSFNNHRELGRWVVSY